MHTVVQTHAFRRAAAEAGMSDDEIDSLVNYVSENPQAGVEIVGTGGCRKLRVAGRGKGKSGGYRSITFYSGTQMPVFLLTVFGKGEKSTLTASECRDLKQIAKGIVDAYRARVTPVARKG